jgi:YidC/Oxa1 family membrane protein insertase
MDRKGWIIVTLCVIGLVVNWYVGVKNYTAPQPASPTVVEPGKDAPVDPSQPGTEPGADAVSDVPSEPLEPVIAEERHEIASELVRYELSNLGGGVIFAEMLKTADRVQINEFGEGPVGAISREVGFLRNLRYQVAGYVPGQSVTYEVDTPEGIRVRKEFRLPSGENSDPHLLEVIVTLSNTGQQPHQSAEWYLYAGAAVSENPGEFVQPRIFWRADGDVDYKETRWFEKGFMGWRAPRPELTRTFEDISWAGVSNRFFASFLTPVSGEDGQAVGGRIWAKRFPVPMEGSERVEWGVHGAVGLPAVQLAAGESISHTYEIYMGPKEYRRLRDLGTDRGQVMTYGMFGLFSRMLMNLMVWIHNLIGSWGWSVVLMTFVIRIFLWPLHAKSTRTMKKMSLLAPKMTELREKYKDEPQKMQAETLKMYREYGINPFGGCLPIFFQIPIFFGFYRMLMFAAELRGEDFFWVADLSQPDTVGYLLGVPINPLPLLMAVTMIIQMKVSPQAGDKLQRRIFMFMPLIFLVICYNFASALALYWTSQNVFSIFQTWFMNLREPPTLEKVKRKPASERMASLLPPNHPNAKRQGKPKKKSTRTGGSAARSRGPKKPS